MVTIKDYGQARQITLFEDGNPVLQVLTSDTGAPAAALLVERRSRFPCRGFRAALGTPMWGVLA